MKQSTLRHRFLYGIGYMGVLVSGILFQNFVTYYYIQHVKLNPAWIGIGFGIVSVWEAVIAPFVGYISDRTHTRWGRRVPYVVVGIPLMAIFLCLLFNPAFNASQPVLAMAWFITTVFVFDSIFMVIDVNWQAVNAEMNVDLPSRSQQGAIVGVLSMVGVAAAASATLPLAEKFGWPNTAIFIALFSTVVGLIGVAGLKENPSFSTKQPLGLKDAIRYTVSYKPSLFYLGLATLIKIAMFSISTMIPLFAVWVLAIPEGQSGILLLASSGGMLICFPFAAMLVNKVGPRKAILAGFTITLLPALVLLFPLTNFPLIVGLFGCLAIGFSLLMMGQMILLSDVIDADAVHVGQRREGIYNSAYAFVQKIGAFIFSVTMGIVLGAVGFQSSLNAQTPQALAAIKGLTIGAPILVSLLGILLNLKYPISDAEAKLIREKAIQQRKEFAESSNEQVLNPEVV